MSEREFFIEFPTGPRDERIKPSMFLVLDVNSSSQRATCGVVSGVDSIGRRAEADAAIVTQIEQGELRPWLRDYPRPGSLGNLFQKKLAVLLARKPVADYGLDECRSNRLVRVTVGDGYLLASPVRRCLR